VRFHLRAALCAILAVAACQSPAPPRPRNVVLVVADTLRADHLGSYGDTRGLTPFLDALAARGVRFANAYAASSWTVPSVASLFTARFPSQHHVDTFDAVLPAAELTLAESLTAAGWAPAGFTANLRLTAELGFTQGFHMWSVHTPAPGASKVRGSELRGPALSWLTVNGGARPWLLYLQFMEPHGPYEPPQAQRSRHAAAELAAADAQTANRKLEQGELDGVGPAELALLRALYAGEVAALDDELRALFGELERRGFLRDTVVVVTADHGEELGEHGGLGHGRTLYNETLRVPLIVAGTGIDGGRVLDTNVSLVDLAPTLLDLLGRLAEPRFEGQSFAALLRAPTLLDRLLDRPYGPAARRPILGELPPAGTEVERRLHQRALVQERLKLIVPLTGEAELFDLATDPAERSANPATKADQTKGMKAALHATTTALRARAAATPQRGTVDPATRERLRALGYRF
jgi:arylsulfatase